MQVIARVQLCLDTTSSTSAGDPKFVCQNNLPCFLNIKGSMVIGLRQLQKLTPLSLLHTNRQICRHRVCPVWVIPLELGALSAEHWPVRPDQEADQPSVPVLHSVCDWVALLK